MPRTILLVRHASSSGQAHDAPLTPEGILQAETLVSTLAAFPITRIVSSPYLRAVETIRPFAMSQNLNIAKVDGLRERVLAPEPREDWLDHVRRSFEDENYALPGGESLKDTADRGLAALTDLSRTSRGTVVAVSHGNLIAAILHRIDPNFGFDGWASLGNPEVISLTTRDGVPVAFTR